MTLVQAVVLGLAQGLTEFIPVSSTAHLRVIPALLGWDDPGAAASAVIQLGTLAAVLIYFAREIVDMIVHGQWVDSSRAEQELGFCARPLADTIRCSHAWYRQNGYLR